MSGNVGGNGLIRNDSGQDNDGISKFVRQNALHPDILVLGSLFSGRRAFPRRNDSGRSCTEGCEGSAPSGMKKRKEENMGRCREKRE